MKYDIFISYKRKSLPTANNLYYRLTTRGYSTFFDLEEMRADNFNVQLLNYIENSKDVFVIIEQGSLDGCMHDNWENDWFLYEIAYALENRKNIIPILLNGFKMPNEDFFPDKLKELRLKNAPEFSFSYFEEYLNKLIAKQYIKSEAHISNQSSSVFKFFSNENCQVFKEGKLVCSLDGMADEPFYLPVKRRGDFRFKAINLITGKSEIITQRIEADEERIIDIEWEVNRDQSIPTENNNSISSDNFVVDLGLLKFNMVRVEGGEMKIGATAEQGEDVENNEKPAHFVSLPTFYIGQFPITQNIWEFVMGYNKSGFKEKEKKSQQASVLSKNNSARTSALPVAGALIASNWLHINQNRIKNKIKSHIDFEQVYDEYGHYPVENISHDEAQEFVRRLSIITNIKFSLPTEDEWEFAARGGVKSMKYKYAGSNVINEVAWYHDNSDNSTHPVGEKKPNELGLFDMSGNVWEWTETPAHSYAIQIVRTSLLDEITTFIRRGGSWWHEAKNCRVSSRYVSDHTKKTNGLGLRVVIRENVK